MSMVALHSSLDSLYILEINPLNIEYVIIDLLLMFNLDENHGKDANPTLKQAANQRELELENESGRENNWKITGRLWRSRR